MELLVFGHAGEPVIAFPTSCGHFWDWEDFGMIDAVRDRIEAGSLMLLCVDSVDRESFYNRGVHPSHRVARDEQYDAYITQEVVPFIRSRTDRPIALAGASFGGYHAVDKGLRHPDIFYKLLSMSGAYNMSWFLSGHKDTAAYLRMPLEYLPNLADPWYLDKMRSQHILLAIGEHDFLLNQNVLLSKTLESKSIPSHLDVWAGYKHDWPAWKGMLRKHIGW
jgi:esterase/lipase superfamily enzyme